MAQESVYTTQRTEWQALYTALSRLYAAYGSRSPLEGIALKAAAIITPLLLQQPSGKPTYRDNVALLTRRLKLWEEGSIAELSEKVQQLVKSQSY